MWHVTHGGGQTFALLFSSPAFTVCDRQCSEDSERVDGSINESMNEWINVSVNEWINGEGVYRTALATPDMWNTLAATSALLEIDHLI